MANSLINIQAPWRAWMRSIRFRNSRVQLRFKTSRNRSDPIVSRPTFCDMPTSLQSRSRGWLIIMRVRTQMKMGVIVWTTSWSSRNRSNSTWMKSRLRSRLNLSTSTPSASSVFSRTSCPQLTSSWVSRIRNKSTSRSYLFCKIWLRLSKRNIIPFSNDYYTTHSSIAKWRLFSATIALGPRWSSSWNQWQAILSSTTPQRHSMSTRSFKHPPYLCHTEEASNKSSLNRRRLDNSKATSLKERQGPTACFNLATNYTVSLQ